LLSKPHLVRLALPVRSSCSCFTRLNFQQDEIAPLFKWCVVERQSNKKPFLGLSIEFLTLYTPFLIAGRVIVTFIADFSISIYIGLSINIGMVMENICLPSGFWAHGIRVEIKTQGKDLGLIISNPPSQFFGAFTQNSFAAAPVQYCKEVLKSGQKISHLVVNSGNANACTGPQGLLAVQETVKALRQGFPRAEGVLVASTGVIGHQLPLEKITQGLNSYPSLHTQTPNEDAFCEAILTTDLVKKETAQTLQFASGTVHLGGVCKGSGMIHPNMATMLAFITTDIDLPSHFQNQFLKIVEKSFNSISVDGDQSTNDTVFLLANGASGVSYTHLSPTEQAQFVEALQNCFISLAKQIAADGEGATKLVEIRVTGAASADEAQKIARQVSNSPLVKTALFGNDPNWGRIVASLGSLGLAIPQDHCRITLGDQILFDKGSPLPKDMPVLKKTLSAKEVVIGIDLQRGSSDWSFWTCDFSYDYVKINAEYHT